MVDFFRRNKRRYMIGEAASVLARVDTLRWSEKDARLVIDHLLRGGKLHKAGNFLWKGALMAPRGN